MEMSDASYLTNCREIWNGTVHFEHNPHFDTEENTRDVTGMLEEVSDTVEYVSLHSADGFSFVVPFSTMSISETLFHMVKGSGEFKEQKSVIHVPGTTPPPPKEAREPIKHKCGRKKPLHFES